VRRPDAWPQHCTSFVTITKTCSFTADFGHFVVANNTLYHMLLTLRTRCHTGLLSSRHLLINACLIRVHYSLPTLATPAQCGAIIAGPLKIHPGTEL
jgi:hypothetical protein